MLADTADTFIGRAVLQSGCRVVFACIKCSCAFTERQLVTGSRNGKVVARFNVGRVDCTCAYRNNGVIDIEEIGKVFVDAVGVEGDIARKSNAFILTVVSEHAVAVGIIPTCCSCAFARVGVSVRSACSCAGKGLFREEVGCCSQALARCQFVS